MSPNQVRLFSCAAIGFLLNFPKTIHYKNPFYKDPVKPPSFEFPLIFPQQGCLPITSRILQMK